MRSTNTIDNYVGRILTGTSLPMERRREVADEIRDHLASAIQRHMSGAMSQEDATRRAIDTFGDARRIRRRLQRQQVSKDLRAACRSTMKLLWLPAFFGAMTSMGLTGLTPGDAASLRWAGGLFFFTWVFAGTGGLMLAANYFELLVKRARPVAEFHPVACRVRWCLILATAWVTVLTGATVLTGVGAIAFGLWPAVDLFPWYFTNVVPTVLIDSAVRGVLIITLSSAGGAWAIVRYERQRCVHESPEGFSRHASGGV